MEKKNKITTAKQFETLIREIEKKPILARGVSRGIAQVENYRQVWENITVKLNALGPPVRNCDGWLRVWKDYKFKLKKKIIQKEAEKNAVGGNFKNISLYPLEELAAKLCFSENQFSSENFISEFQPAEEDHTIWEEEEILHSENQSTVEEIKTEDYCLLDQSLLGDEDYMPPNSVNSYQVHMLASPDRTKKKRNRKYDQRQELLETHNSMQEEVFSQISKTMKELKDIIKDSTRNQQKMLDVEEQKLRIMQQQHEKEELLFRSEIKLKMMELKLKAKELEALEKQS